MFKKIFKLYYLLNKFQKICILYMLILTLLSSVLELLSITGIIYFINIISKDQIIVPSNFVDKILTDLSIFFGLEVIYFVGITIIVLLTLSNFLISNHFFNSYFSTKITFQFEDLMNII